jgi:hypothetical protein
MHKTSLKNDQGPALDAKEHPRQARFSAVALCPAALTVSYCSNNRKQGSRQGVLPNSYHQKDGISNYCSFMFLHGVN